MKTIIRIYFLFLLTGLTLLSCGKKTEEKGAAKDSAPDASLVELTAEQYKVADIQLGQVEKKTLSNVLTVSGVLDVPPQNLISVSAPLGGFVQSTKLLPGSRIKKGQVIVVMEHPDFIQLQQDYLDSKSKLEYMELEYARQKELQKENVGSGKVFQQTTSEYKMTKNRVNALEEKLTLIGINPKQLDEGKISRSAPIYATINGYVTVVNVNTGKYVNPTDVMFEIVNTDDMHLQLTIFEKDAASIKQGQKIKFSLPNESDKERTATVYLIGRSIRDDRTVNVHAHIDKQPDPALLPGMFVKAMIETSDNKVSAVPDESIVQSEGKHYIYTFNGKKQENKQEIFSFNMLEVKTGASENGYSEVILPDNFNITSTQIVTKGAFSLLSKMKNSEE